MVHSIVTSRIRRPIRAQAAAFLLFVGGFFTIASTARAQAVYTADRVNGFSVFGEFSAVNTDYGVNDSGYAFGGDFSHSIKLRWLTPSLEVRYTGTTGQAITQNSFSGGLKLETHYHRLRPYANLLAGYGQIHYVKVKQDDDSIIYDFGVGADYAVFGPYSLQVEAHQQSWKLGQATSALTPQSVSVGVMYRLPSSFRKH